MYQNNFFLFAGKLVAGWGSEFKVDWFWSLCKTEGKHIHMLSCDTEEDFVRVSAICTFVRFYFSNGYDLYVQYTIYLGKLIAVTFCLSSKVLKSSIYR